MSETNNSKGKGKISYALKYMFSWLLELQFPQKSSYYVFRKAPTRCLMAEPMPHWLLANSLFYSDLESVYKQNFIA